MSLSQYQAFLVTKMTRMQGSNTNIQFSQHGDAEGVNPGNAPYVSANFQKFSGAQTTPSAPTRHIPVVNHQRAVPDSPISSPLDPRDGKFELSCSSRNSQFRPQPRNRSSYAQHLLIVRP